MTEVLHFDLEVSGQTEVVAPSRPLPYNATIREIHITTDLTNIGSTILIGITQSPDFPNLPAIQEWNNILSYLSNIPTVQDRRIRMITNTTRLRRLAIPVQQNDVIAIAYFNNEPLPTNIAHPQISITLEVQEQ
jgi:hypothetical protein